MSSPTPPSPNDLTRQQLDELDTLLQRMLSLPLSAPPPEPPARPAPAPLPDLPAASPSGSWRADPTAPARVPYLSHEPAATLPAPAVASAGFNGSGPPGTAPWAVGLALPTVEVPSAPPEPAPVPAWGPDVSAQLAPPAAPGPLRGVDAPALPAGFEAGYAPVPLTPPAAVEAPMATAPVQPVEAPAPVEPTPTAVREPAGRSLPVLLWPLAAANGALEAVLGLCGPVGAAATHPVGRHLLGGTGLVLLAAAGAWAARGMGYDSFPVPPLGR